MANAPKSSMNKKSKLTKSKEDDKLTFSRDALKDYIFNEVQKRLKIKGALIQEITTFKERFELVFQRISDVKFKDVVRDDLKNRNLPEVRKRLHLATPKPETARKGFKDIFKGKQIATKKIEHIQQLTTEQLDKILNIFVWSDTFDWEYFFWHEARITNIIEFGLSSNKRYDNSKDLLLKELIDEENFFLVKILLHDEEYKSRCPFLATIKYIEAMKTDERKVTEESKTSRIYKLIVNMDNLAHKDAWQHIISNPDYHEKVCDTIRSIPEYHHYERNPDHNNNKVRAMICEIALEKKAFKIIDIIKSTWPIPEVPQETKDAVLQDAKKQGDTELTCEILQRDILSTSEQLDTLREALNEYLKKEDLEKLKIIITKEIIRIFVINAKERTWIHAQISQEEKAKILREAKEEKIKYFDLIIEVINRYSQDEKQRKETLDFLEISLDAFEAPPLYYRALRRSCHLWNIHFLAKMLEIIKKHETLSEKANNNPKFLPMVVENIIMWIKEIYDQMEKEEVAKKRKSFTWALPKLYRDSDPSQKIQKRKFLWHNDSNFIFQWLNLIFMKKIEDQPDVKRLMQKILNSQDKFTLFMLKKAWNLFTDFKDQIDKAFQEAMKPPVKEEPKTEVKKPQPEIIGTSDGPSVNQRMKQKAKNWKKKKTWLTKKLFWKKK